MALNAGEKLGPYEIESKIGAGGMGEVYLASDTRLGRKVALKVLPAHLSQNPELRQRLEREARAISSLSHPHICALYDIGQENGTDFLVMEYLEGETLAARLEKGPLPLEQVLRYGMEIAGALDKAHRQGIVHRDLKPGNIVLTRSGAKLLDFGLASVRPPAGPMAVSASGYATAEQPLTAEGTILGTFQYMAPEQLEGEEADARTDLFALGLVLYEMATGAKAFTGKSQASLIAAIVSGKPRPMAEVQPLTPPVLERVVLTCLAKDREERWQTARDVALQLEWIAEGGSQVGLPAPVSARRRNRERIAWTAAAVGTAAAVALGIGHLLRPTPPEPEPIRFRIPPPENLVATGSPRISPDGRFLAFPGRDSSGRSMIWVRPLGTLESRALPGTEGTGRPFWSPDSRHLAFFAGGKLKKVAVAGGPAITVADIPGGVDGTWGSGDVILFDGGSSDSIQQVSASGGLASPATEIRRDRGEAYHAWPLFLPDGDRFLFLAYGSGAGETQIAVGSLSSGETVELATGVTRMEYVPPGYLLYVQDGTLLAQPFDTRRLRLTGDPFPVADEVGTIGSGLAHFSASNNGVLIFRGGGGGASRLAIHDRTGEPIQRFGEPARYSSPALSPDGARVAVVIDEAGSDVGDIWILEPARGVSTRFTFDPANDSNPIWSPDGSRIVFSSNRGGSYGLYQKPSDGSGVEDRLPIEGDALVPSHWSRDGRHLLYLSLSPGRGWDLFHLPLSGEGGEPLVTGGEFPDHQGRYSPDGRWVAYASVESGTWEIYVRAFPGPGGKWQVSTRGGTEPRWREDGREIYYLSLDRKLMAVEVSGGERFASAAPRELFEAPVSSNIFIRNRYEAFPDGERFLFVEPVQQSHLPSTTVVVHWLSSLRPQGD